MKKYNFFLLLIIVLCAGCGKKMATPSSPLENFFNTEYLFTVPSNSISYGCVDENSTFYLADKYLNQVCVIDSEGKELRRIGSYTNPLEGDMGLICSIAVSEKLLFVGTFHGGSEGSEMKIFTKEGKELSRWQVPMPVTQILLFESEQMIYAASGHSDLICIYKYNGEKVSGFFEREEIPWPTGANTFMDDKDELIYSCRRLPYEIRVFTKTGMEQKRFGTMDCLICGPKDWNNKKGCVVNGLNVIDDLLIVTQMQDITGGEGVVRRFLDLYDTDGNLIQLHIPVFGYPFYSDSDYLYVSKKTDNGTEIFRLKPKGVIK